MAHVAHVVRVFGQHTQVTTGVGTHELLAPMSVKTCATCAIGAGAPHSRAEPVPRVCQRYWPVTCPGALPCPGRAPLLSAADPWERLPGHAPQPARCLVLRAARPVQRPLQCRPTGRVPGCRDKAGAGFGRCLRRSAHRWRPG